MLTIHMLNALLANDVRAFLMLLFYNYSNKNLMSRPIFRNKWEKNCFILFYTVVKRGSVFTYINVQAS